MKIGIILGGSNFLAQRSNPVMVETIDELRQRGAVVEVIEPRIMSFDLREVRVRHDLYVIKSIANPLAASYGATLHALGAPTFNRHPLVQRIRNKIVTLRLLSEHEVPVPETYVASEAASLVPLLDRGPLIVKPYMGSRGVGVTRVTTREELDTAASESPILAQRFYPSDDGLDHKISVIGDKVFGVRRIFPIRVYSDKLGTPVDVDDETREIARRISRAIEIDMFSFDLIISEGRKYVVDVSSFGSMMGVPNAPALLAARIIQAWEERESR